MTLLNNWICQLKSGEVSRSIFSNVLIIVAIYRTSVE